MPNGVCTVVSADLQPPSGMPAACHDCPTPVLACVLVLGRWLPLAVALNAAAARLVGFCCRHHGES